MNAIPSLLPQARDEERARLVALYDLGLLDMDRDPELDDLTRLAVQVLEVPLARITLVAKREVRSLASSGTVPSPLRWPRSQALCDLALGREASFVASAQALATRDEGLDLAFYAAAVLRSAEGHPIGTFHVADQRPRSLDLRQLNALADLGRLAERRLLDASQREEPTALGHYFRDPVTGLVTEQALRAQLEKRLLTGSPRVARVNIENLETVEAKHGWALATEVARQIAERLVEVLPGTVSISRIRWDAFAFLVPQAWAPLLDSEVAFLGQRLTFPVDVEAVRVHPRITVGVSDPASLDDDPDRVLQQAGRLNRAAHDQGSLTLVESPAMKDARARDAQLLHRLERAIREERLTLAYQPKFDMACQPVGGEVLARWIDDELGFVSPGEFIPLAERHGLIRELGWCVIHMACAHIASAKAQGLPTTPVAINLSAPQVAAFGFVGELLETLRCFDLTPHDIQLEVTESVLADDVEEMARTLGELSARGFAISMDDYGTGYSSLRYLKQLPLTYLKIDRAFVRDMQNDVDDAAIVEATIAMAHALSLEVIAEGVEERVQWELLRDFGCDQLQGFWLGRPMPWDDFCAVVAAKGCR